MRYLPKETGFRAIVNLKRKRIRQQDDRKTSINGLLENLFKVISMEKKRLDKERPFSASVLGTQEIYERLREYKGRQKEGPYHLAKVDVKACFDSIPHCKLLEVLRNVGLFSSPTYVIQRYVRLYISNGQVRINYVKRPLRRKQSLVESMIDSRDTSCVYVDQVNYQVEEKAALEKLLEDHLLLNSVFFDGNYYHQKVGIPQGSVLSAVLCSLFYNQLDAQYLSFLNRPDTLMLRYIDDFLCISTDSNVITAFLQTMTKGIPDFSCYVNPTKTLTTLQYPLTDFPWCGLFLSPMTLEIKPDYCLVKIPHSSFHSLRDSFSLDVSHRKYSKILEKLKLFLLPKCHSLFMDVIINPMTCILSNIKNNFSYLALKFMAYLKALRKSFPFFNSSRFLNSKLVH